MPQIHPGFPKPQSLNRLHKQKGKVMTPNPTLKYNYSLKIGDSDHKGRIIAKIYSCEEGICFIYFSDKGELVVAAEDETLVSKNLKFNELLIHISHCFSHRKSLKDKYASGVAYAIKLLYDDALEAAVYSLDSISKDIRRHLRRQAEIAYLFGAFIVVIVSLISYFLLYKFGNLNDLGNLLFSAVAFSSLGGFLSVATSADKIKIDIISDFWIKMLYGSMRIVIAIISGVIVYFIIESKLLLGFFKDIQNVNILYVAFVLSGFSEKLIPNLMLDFESKRKTTN